MTSSHLPSLSTLALEVLADVAWGPEAVLSALGDAMAIQLWNVQRGKSKLYVALLDALSKLQGASNPLPRSLDLRPCATNACVARLRLFPLTSLRAHGCIKFTDGFGLAQALPMLTSLDLSKCSGLPDTAVRRLGTLTSLTRLSVADTGCSSLEWLTPLTRLAHLCMARTRVTDAALPHVPVMPALLELDLSAVSISSAAIAQHLPSSLPNVQLLDFTGVSALAAPAALATLLAPFQQAASTAARSVTVSLLQRRLVFHAPHTSAADALALLTTTRRHAETRHEQGMAGGLLGELLEAFVAPAQASTLSSSSASSFLPTSAIGAQASAPPLTHTALLLAERLRAFAATAASPHTSPSLAPPPHNLSDTAPAVSLLRALATAEPPPLTALLPADPFALPAAMDADVDVASPRVVPPSRTACAYRNADQTRPRGLRVRRWSKVEDAVLLQVAERAQRRGWASVMGHFEADRSAAALEARYRLLYQPSPRRPAVLLPQHATRLARVHNAAACRPITKRCATAVSHPKRARALLSPPARSPARRLLPELQAAAPSPASSTAPSTPEFLPLGDTALLPACASSPHSLSHAPVAPPPPPPPPPTQTAPTSLSSAVRVLSPRFIPRTPPPLGRVEAQSPTLASILATRIQRATANAVLGHAYVPPSPMHRIAALLASSTPPRLPLRPASVVSPLPNFGVSHAHAHGAPLSPVPTVPSQTPSAAGTRVALAPIRVPSDVAPRQLSPQKKAPKMLRVPVVPMRLQPRQSKRRATTELASRSARRKMRASDL